MSIPRAYVDRITWSAFTIVRGKGKMIGYHYFLRYLTSRHPKSKEGTVTCPDG
jgi:hypothetical protein